MWCLFPPYKAATVFRYFIKILIFPFWIRKIARDALDTMKMERTQSNELRSRILKSQRLTLASMYIVKEFFREKNTYFFWMSCVIKRLHILRVQWHFLSMHSMSFWFMHISSSIRLQRKHACVKFTNKAQ